VQNTPPPEAKPEHQEKGHPTHAFSSLAASGEFRLAVRILAAS
jgi:hypothetical protein